MYITTGKYENVSKIGDIFAFMHKYIYALQELMYYTLT